MNTSSLTSLFRRGPAKPRPGLTKDDGKAAPTAADASNGAKAGCAEGNGADTAAAPVEPAAAVETGPASPPPSPPASPPVSRLVERARRKRAGSFNLAGVRPKLESIARQSGPAALPVAAAAAIALSLGVGYGLGALARTAPQEGVAAAHSLELSGHLRRSNEEMARITTELNLLKASIEGGNAKREALRREVTTRHAEITEKLDRAMQDQAARAARFTEAFERLERAQRDPGRSQALNASLERIERQLAAASPTNPSTPPAKPVAAVTSKPEVSQTGSILSEPKGTDKLDPDPRKSRAPGYFVRDYDSGFALIETRSGRYLDVAVGQNIPGLGRVETIERRGREWVVVTPKGYISER